MKISSNLGKKLWRSSRNSKYICYFDSNSIKFFRSKVLGVWYELIKGTFVDEEIIRR